MTISAVGSVVRPAVVAGPPPNFPMTPTTIGNVIVLFAQPSAVSPTASPTITGITSANARWVFLYRTTQFAALGDNCFIEIWIGFVTATSLQTVTCTTSATVHTLQIDLQEFSSTNGISAQWALDKGGFVDNPSSTAVPGPTLVPSNSPRLYFGFASVDQTGAAGSTSGFTYQVDSVANVEFHKVNVTASESPSCVQSPADLSRTVGVLITDPPPCPSFIQAA